MDLKKAHKILIIRPDMIGDCLLITPALKLLKDRFPESHLTVLCRPYTKEIFLNNPDVDEVIEDGRFSKLYRTVRSKKFNLSVHFYNELRYALLAKLCGIKKRLGDRSKPLLIPFYNIKSDCRWNDLTLHEVEHNILLLKPLGIELEASPPPLQLKVPVQLVEKFEKDYGINPRDLLIGVHLGTGRGNKAWLKERYAKVIDHLAEKHKALVVLTGSHKELKAAREVEGLCKKKPLNLVGRTTLSELISLISRYNLYLSVDTGPLHIAAALGIKTVALFPTKFVKPTEWGPCNTEHVIIHKAASCSKSCRPQKCTFDDCLRDISSEEVISAAEKLLENQGIKSFKEAKIEWFKRSVNVLCNRDEIIRELTILGCHAVKLELPQSLPELIGLMIKEDINLIHWVGLSQAPFLVKLAKIISTPQLAIPPLLIHNRQSITHDLISCYIKKFKERK